MPQYWFHPKRYGFGFGIPTCWQGWLSLAILLGLILLSAHTNNLLIVTENSTIMTEKDGLRFLLDVIIITGVFTALLRDKVEGGLVWHWGNTK